MLKERLKVILFLIIFTLAFENLYSQKYNIKQLSAEEGLLQSQISSIVQDKNGSLLLCSTGSGLISYNGKSFSEFQFPDKNIKSSNITRIFKDSKNILWFSSTDGLIKCDENPPRLITESEGFTDKNASVVFEDSKGIIWIGSKTGLTKYDGKFVKIKEINHNNIIEDIISIKEDSNGNLWLTNGKKIQRFNENSLRSYNLGIPSPRNVIRRLFFDSKKTLWAATVSGLYYFENESFKKFTQNKILQNHSILKIFESADGEMWFSVRDYGVIKWDRKNFLLYNDKNGLGTTLVFEIYQDKEKNIWFGTNEGLEVYTDNAFIKYDKSSGLPENLVWSVFEDSKHNIWTASDKFGFTILNNGTIKRFEKQKAINADQYYGVYQDKRGIYWFATRTGLFKFNGSKVEKITEAWAIKNYGVSIICGDSKNNVWFCTFSNGVVKYDGNSFTQYNEKNGLLEGEVYYVFDDGKGNIWIPTAKGISIYDGKKFRNYPQSRSKIKKEIFDIKKDKWGGIWCASYGEGLYKMETLPDAEPKIEQVTVKDGLISDNIFLIEIDNYDRMWVGTQAGLCYFSLKDYYNGNKIIIKKFNREDGIPHAEYNQAASFKDSKGFLWFGTNKGLIKCDPSKIKENPIEPVTLIKDLKIFYRDEDLSKYGVVHDNPLLPEGLKLPYDMNHITISFIGISLSGPSKIRYKYILENFDKEWHQATEKNYETYSNLPSGSYTFKVIACNDAGIWNKTPVSYSFKISTPYFKTWWFISLAIILIVSTIWLLHKLRIREIQHLNKELKKTLSERIITEKRLLQSENDYRGLFENAHDAILIIDPVRFVILAANEEACRMYGYSKEEILGLPFSKISNDFERSKMHILDTLQHNKWGDYEVQHISKTGELFDLDANATVINYKGNVALVAILHNITERKIIEKALIEARDQAEKSNQLKSNFLAQMSHEIRTPINTILSYTSLLKTEIQNIVPEELKEGFTFIENGGRRLIRTIDSILNMSQIQSGNQELFPERIRLYEDVLLKLYNELKQTAANNSLEFTIENKAFNDLIVGDNYSLSQLFSNLIDNAIKYTPAGMVQIVIENKTPDTVTSYIKDTGIGISEEFLPNIFEPFSQEEMGYTRHFEGNGLGLALVKSYCDLNKGSIQVESQKGAGTTFIVTFSLVKK